MERCMERTVKEIAERLSVVGLARVLDDLLDLRQLVRLANAADLKYPGMRAQSQSRDRLVHDLADRVSKNAAARKAVLRVVAKAAEAGKTAWLGLPAADKTRQLADDEAWRAKGALGRWLYYLAATPDEAVEGFDPVTARERLLSLASRSTTTATHSVAQASPSEVRLQKKVTALENKLRHVESLLAKSRDDHKTLKRDLIERKGELAEARMLTERLRREVTEAQSKAVPSPTPSETSAPQSAELAELSLVVRRLAAEHKKLGQQVHKLKDAVDAPHVAPEVDPLAPLLQAVADLQRDISALRRERKRQIDGQSQRIEELRAELRARNESTAPTLRARSRGGPDRVGVFIDVQNMYYGARQLRGKLDFDALLQATVRDRRLIQATAYVVESKEIDQSQFIARLQQRAIDVRRKPLQVRIDGSMKGDWDMELALDILDGAPRLDVVVLVSGDGDFTSLVKRVKSMGPRVEVMAFPQNTAKSLLEAADHFEPLDQRFMIGARSRGAPRRRIPSTTDPAPSQPPDTEPAASSEASPVLTAVPRGSRRGA